MCTTSPLGQGKVKGRRAQQQRCAAAAFDKTVAAHLDSNLWNLGLDLSFALAGLARLVWQKVFVVPPVSLIPFYVASLCLCHCLAAVLNLANDSNHRASS